MASFCESSFRPTFSFSIFSSPVLLCSESSKTSVLLRLSENEASSSIFSFLLVDLLLNLTLSCLCESIGRVPSSSELPESFMRSIWYSGRQSAIQINLFYCHVFYYTIEVFLLLFKYLFVLTLLKTHCTVVVSRHCSLALLEAH